MFWNRKKETTNNPEPSAKPVDIYSFMDGLSMDTAGVMRQYIDENAVKVNAPVPDGVAMDSCYTTPSAISYESINPIVFAHYVATGQFIGYPAMAIISQQWLVRKGCEMMPSDAARKWYEIESGGDELAPEQIKLIEKLDRKYKLKQNVVEACTFNNIFGVRHILFKHTNPDFDYSKPFNPDEFKGGGYAGISQIDPNRLTPEFNNEDLTDPASINYLNPTWWSVNGKKIHKSHMVILYGDMVPDILKPTYRYGGVSVVQKVYERVYAAERTANEAPQLTMTKRLTWRKADLTQIAAKPSKFGTAMQRIVEFRNNFGVQLIGKDEDMGQLDTTLTDLDQVIMGQYLLVCSIFGIPASKLMGSGHSGFGDGQQDGDYYIENLEEIQSSDMTPLVEAHYRRLIPAYAGDISIDPSTSIIPAWRALKVMSYADIAAVNLQNRQADQIAYQAQAIDNYEFRERLINDPNSGFDNLTMPEEADIDDLEGDSDSVNVK